MNAPLTDQATATAEKIAETKALLEQWVRKQIPLQPGQKISVEVTITLTAADDADISILNLPQSTAKFLREYGLGTMSAFCRKSAWELYKYRAIGPRKLARIMHAVQNAGRELAEGRIPPEVRRVLREKYSWSI